MARGNTAKGKGLFRRAYGPIDHLFQAGRESVGAVTNTAKGVIGVTFNGVNKVGRSVTGHANMAVSGLLTGKSRKNRKGGKRNTRKNRKANRKSRRNNRK
jgi:hypothetical protein